MRYFWIFIVILAVLAVFYFSGIIGGIPVQRIANRQAKPDRES